jgi:hypothetical protein
MGFLNKLFGKKKEPIWIELLKGELKLKIWDFEILKTGSPQKTKALAFLTEGLYRHQQEELFLVLSGTQYDQNNYPEEIPQFFDQILDFAKRGMLVQIGAYTQFGQRKLLEKGGIIYAEVPSFLKDQFKQPTISMILVEEEEVEAAQDFGVLRILSMLGDQIRYFPYPYWSDFKRSKLEVKGMRQQTIVKDLNRLSIPQAIINIENKRISLEIQEDFDFPMTLDHLSASSPVAILPMLSPEANACLTFDPEFKTAGPRAISDAKGDGSVIAACFLMLMGEQQSFYSRIYEDGVALGFENKDWEDFWKALIAKENYLIDGGEGQMPFQLIWK